MSDLCECGILKSKCTHPNCSDNAAWTQAVKDKWKAKLIADKG